MTLTGYSARCWKAATRERDRPTHRDVGSSTLLREREKLVLNEQYCTRSHAAQGLPNPAVPRNTPLPVSLTA